jgi:hypothetical protein
MRIFRYDEFVLLLGVMLPYYLRVRVVYSNSTTISNVPLA